jgi:hypothetical protein
MPAPAPARGRALGHLSFEHPTSPAPDVRCQPLVVPRRCEASSVLSQDLTFVPRCCGLPGPLLPVLEVIEDGTGHDLFIDSGGSGTIPLGGRCTNWIAAMPMPKECRQHAEECLRLAKETPQIYARQALLELAAEFREVAEELERRSSHSTDAKRRRGHNNFAPPRRRRAS